MTAIDGPVVRTECVRGGTVRSGQGVNVPAERLSLPAITERDREGLARALDLGVDLVAQSFVRGPQDIKELRSLMGDRAVPIVAKIETKPAVEGIDKILRVTDVVMVARGDLGVELPMEEIPLLQKDLLRAARAAVDAGDRGDADARVDDPCTAAHARRGHRRRERRAGRRRRHHAVGRDRDRPLPVRGGRGRREDRGAPWNRGARSTGRRSRRAGTPARDRRWLTRPPPSRSEDRNVVAITCYTETGRTARLLSAERPGCPVFAFIPGEDVRRASAVLWGVTPLPARRPADTDEMIALMDEGLQAFGLAAPGDAVVMAAASPAGKTTTNMLKIHRVGSPVR